RRIAEVPGHIALAQVDASTVGTCAYRRGPLDGARTHGGRGQDPTHGENYATRLQRHSRRDRGFHTSFESLERENAAAADVEDRDCLRRIRCYHDRHLAP